MAKRMNSPLSGSVRSDFSGVGRHKSRILFGTAILASIPFVLSTFAASVTVGTGNLEFGQGSQQAVACDGNVFVAMGEEWHGAPTPEDSSAGYFRVRSVTISNFDLESCADKRLRIRMINGSSEELVLGPTEDIKVLQIKLPASAPNVNTGGASTLNLNYLNGIGQLVSSPVIADVAISVSGTSLYDGSALSATSADVTFFLDPSRASVNIDGQVVRRATVETVN
ncbi:MAG: hypothetical protein ACO3P3_04740 [Candidatus Nanopelagicales bacterium]